MTRNRQQGSVLLLTLFLVVLASFALTRFIEKAYSEIMTEGIYVERDRLRMEAYSALESTLAVLYNIAEIEGNLYSPAQGWDDPLGLAGVELAEGVEVRVEFVDEMGKLSLPAAERDQLLRLFEVLGFDAIASEELTDALRSWISQEEAGGSFEAYHLDYERAALPYRPPYRSLHSFYELAAIAGFREAFFDSQGVPNELFYQLTSLVSLYSFNAINVNSASPTVFQIWSNVDEVLTDSIESNREERIGHKPYFESLDEAAGQLGIPLGEGYGVATQCIRVNVTVSDGVADFMLSAVIAPSGQAEGLRPPQAATPPSENRRGSRANPPTPGGLDGQRGSRRRSARDRRREQAAAPNQQEAVPYPYSFLEIRENESIL